jgi:hypothetical protein
VQWGSAAGGFGGAGAGGEDSGYSFPGFRKQAGQQGAGDLSMDVFRSGGGGLFGGVVGGSGGVRDVNGVGGGAGGSSLLFGGGREAAGVGSGKQIVVGQPEQQGLGAYSTPLPKFFG